MKYPNYKLYEKLYAKYINEQNLFNMMDLAGESYKGKNFLDICCGNGAATIEAFNRGASCCYLLDKEPDMVPKKLQRIIKKRVYEEYPIKMALGLWAIYNSWPNFDIVFCKQGVNYWFDSETIQVLSEKINKDGVFVFNTFNTKPTTEPIIKEYYLYNTKFLEISYLVDDDIIHHVQVREGYPPHITEFKWISEEFFRSCLEGYFYINIFQKDKTDVYKCVRK